MKIQTTQKETAIVTEIAQTQERLIDACENILKLHDAKKIEIVVHGAFSYKITIQVT